MIGEFIYLLKWDIDEKEKLILYFMKNIDLTAYQWFSMRMKWFKFVWWFKIKYWMYLKKGLE